MKFVALSFTVLISLTLFTSCNAIQQPQIAQPILLITEETQPENPGVFGTSESPDFSRLNLILEFQETLPAKYEPLWGTYLGANIQYDHISSSMRNFDDTIGVNHAVFAYDINLDEPYPFRWVLENIAAMKTPIITVYPAENSPASRIFDRNAITEFAKNVGHFNVPIFINLFPLTDINFAPSEYIDFFRYAYEEMRRYAPNAALVWGMNAENLHIANQFYPGRDYVDWIKLSIYSEVSTQGEFGDFFEYIDIFNSDWQKERPLMLSVAVSHYTLENNGYFSWEAAEKIYDIYQRISEYPRVRAMVYQNFDGLRNPRMDFEFAQNFMVNTVDVVQAAYAAAVSNQHFLSSMNNISLQPAVIQIRSDFSAIEKEGFYYIPHNALSHDLDFPDLNTLEEFGIIFDGEIYYPMHILNSVFEMDFFKIAAMPRNTLVLR
ncbi:MAG: hypothetical protein FWD01_01330 [Defluviitaleaceae bacterium]|nr:hypothetical protein [Defluviitaleaceae bacterium]